MTGVGRDAALMQAIYVGLVNVVFTLIAMWLIDHKGRRPLLLVGTGAMTVALLTNAYAFNAGTYQLSGDRLAATATDLSEKAAKEGTPDFEAALAALAPLTEASNSHKEFLQAIDRLAGSFNRARRPSPTPFGTPRKTFRRRRCRPTAT